MLLVWMETWEKAHQVTLLTHLQQKWETHVTVKARVTHWLVRPAPLIRQEVLLVQVMNVCHFVEQPFCLLVAVKDRNIDVRWQPRPPPHRHPHTHLQRKDRLPILLSPVPGPGPWHLLDEPGLVLSLSANVWVYWCAVTGPGWSYPTRIRASCCASSVSVCAPMAANRQ